MFQSSDTKIAVLEERIEVYEKMMNRIDSAIEKISETSQNISQMLAIHNEKIEQCNKLDDVIIKMVEEIKVNSKEQHDEIRIQLSERIDVIEVKVDSLSQFKWKALGAVAIIGFLVTFIPMVKTFLTPDSTPATIERTK